MEHRLKTWPEYYQAIKSGKKTFEIRRWDRPFAVGDMLVLQEYNPTTQTHTDDYIKRKITYLLDLAYLPGDDTPHYAGYVAIGLANPEVAKLQAENAELKAKLAKAVVMPCKVGDTVFVLSKNEIVESKITEYSIKENGISFVRLYSTDDRIADYRYENFCKNVFLTRAEAEAALKGAEHD